MNTRHLFHHAFVIAALFAGWALPVRAESEPELKPGELDVLPTLRNAEVPIYPPEMRRAGLEGMVLVEFVVDRNGRVSEPRVIRSNNPYFERPALNAVRRWTFKPGQKGGRAANTRIQQTITFNLEDGQQGWWTIRKGKDHDTLPAELRFDRPPVASYTAYPIYPFDELMAGKKGRVLARLIIGKQGEVAAFETKEVTDEALGRAVAAAVDTWSFVPAKNKDGSPSLAVVVMEFEFNPSGGNGVPVMANTSRMVKLLKKNPEKIVPLAELDRMPKAWSQQAPIYPTALRESGREGEALIEFLIDEEGDAQLPRVVSATVPEFGYSAVQAVATWRFDPPKRNGKPVVARVQVPLSFKLE